MNEAERCDRNSFWRHSAALNTAKSQVLQAESEVEAARATIERIQADIDDSIPHRCFSLFRWRASGSR